MATVVRCFILTLLVWTSVSTVAPQERKKKTQRRAPNQHKITAESAGTFLGGQSGWPLANSCEVRVSSEERYSNITAATVERFKWSQYVENSDYVKRKTGPIKYRKVEIPLMIGPISLQCKGGLKSFGGPSIDGIVDGAKKTCGLTIENNCVIFSIGSFNEWSFEEAIFNGTNCTIHTFDCTLGTGGTSYMGATGGVQVPQALSSRVFGHNFCLGAKDEKIGGNDFRTWESLLQIAKVTHSPTYVKMDIEGERASCLCVCVCVCIGVYRVRRR
jgi:hypothetical protein